MENINFTDNADRKDLLIINQHGGDSPFSVSETLRCELGSPFFDWMEVERDAGAPALAEAIFQITSDFGLRVAKIDFPFSRALIDLNRRPHLASSLPLPRATLADIEEIHREATQEILDTIKRTGPTLILDQHTMAPSAPAESPTLDLNDPRSFEKHVEVWNEAARTGELRPTCIIDSTSAGIEIGNHLFSEILESNLRVSGILNPQFNKPFAPDPAQHQGQLFIGDGRGIALDIPKHELTDTPRSELDLTRLLISQKKVEKIAKQVAMSIKQTLDMLRR